MIGGFVTQAHVVVLCDGCGDRYSETAYAQLCFASVNEAIAYITRRGAGVGWVYDGDKVLCDGCVALAECAARGHRFPEPRRRLLAGKDRSHVCSVCGINDSEIEE
ncbi:hypothetical protein [Nocardia wallacei]|uniref:Uncharacterized protein n=1 Tax=Nocardia wallacei TaxID=480035 RepID=A0A7G1KJ72_9NOCA|nr:hypothetical protein [Nocardia wallacei]BCK53999.1 hypothetical protein NWFMUON74_17710 [Nocardia wallacei]